jgi:hypothetical protein
MNRRNHLCVLTTSAALSQARAERGRAKFDAGLMFGIDDVDVRLEVRT